MIGGADRHTAIDKIHSGLGEGLGKRRFERPFRWLFEVRTPGSLGLVRTRAHRQVAVTAPDDTAGRRHAHAYIPQLRARFEISCGGRPVIEFAVPERHDARALPDSIGLPEPLDR